MNYYFNYEYNATEKWLFLNHIKVFVQILVGICNYNNLLWEGFFMRRVYMLLYKEMGHLIKKKTVTYS